MERGGVGGGCGVGMVGGGGGWGVGGGCDRGENGRGCGWMEEKRAEDVGGWKRRWPRIGWREEKIAEDVGEAY